MNIDLSKEVNDHFERLVKLSKEATEATDESISSRASGMKALSEIIRDLVKTQESIINMERLQRIEKVTISTLKEFLNEDQHKEYLEQLTETLSQQD